MLKRHSQWVATLILTIDLLLTVGAFLAAYQTFQLPIMPHQFGRLAEAGVYLWLLMIIIPLWTMLLTLCKVYHSHRTDLLGTEVKQILKALIMGGVALFSFLAITKSSEISRPFIVVFTVLDAGALILLRVTLRSLARMVRTRGLNYRTVLIVGTGPSAQQQARRIASNPQWGLRVTGFVSDPSESSGEAPPSDLHVLGNAQEMRRLLTEYIVDEVIIAVSGATLAQMDTLLLECEQVGIKTRVALDFFPHRIARIELEDADDCPMLTFTTTPREDFSLVAKRGMDIVGSALFLLSFSWIYAIAIVMIKLTSRGPVFFKQERVGLYGRRFTLYKFRSMVMDAEKRRAELQHLNEMDGPTFKIKSDPRITPVGRLLRKFSIDEFPQMWNVLKGDMSLVGPRPPLASEVEKYDPWARRRLSVRPGITCLWQVEGRNNVSFQKWMELDLAYIDNWSLGLDVKILLKTVPAVLGARGAS
jgi:exopolysaccharide biosynthesis polyprenyl glycosylphosphotransferase